MDKKLTWKTCGVSTKTRLWVTIKSSKFQINKIYPLSISGQTATPSQKKPFLSNWNGRAFILARLFLYSIVSSLSVCSLGLLFVKTVLPTYIVITKTKAITFCTLTFFTGCFFFFFWYQRLALKKESMWIFGLISLLSLSSAATFFKTLTSYGVLFSAPCDDKDFIKIYQFKFEPVKTKLQFEKAFMRSIYKMFHKITIMAALKGMPKKKQKKNKTTKDPQILLLTNAKLFKHVNLHTSLTTQWANIIANNQSSNNLRMLLGFNWKNNAATFNAALKNKLLWQSHKYAVEPVHILNLKNKIYNANSLKGMPKHSWLNEIKKQQKTSTPLNKTPKRLLTETSKQKLFKTKNTVWNLESSKF